MDEYAIVTKGVKKSFGGVHALKDINLRVKRGDIHAIVGENGAGKSTLMKVLAGIHTKDSGTVNINGEEVHFTSPKQSRENKIGIIYQELALAPDLTVAENIFLDDLGFGKVTVSSKDLNKKADRVLKNLGFDIDPTALVGSLTVAYQQMVEIAKSLAKDVNILILDEPSAVLSEREIDILFSQLRLLQGQGVTILYISHRLEEIFRICNAITVIKDGETTRELDPAVCTEDDIIAGMVGRSFENLYPEKSIPQDEVVLNVENMSTHRLLRDVSLHIRKGEIVGLAGLVGSGRTEIARCLFGIDKMSQGKIFKNGKEISVSYPAEAMRHGIGLVPESRKEQGAILSRPIRENTSLANLAGISNRFGILNMKKEREIGELFKEKLKTKLNSIEDPISSLSGGNQQKVVIAKWLNTDCDLLILDEPTRGVDVGAKVEIYNIISELASKGFAVLVISSEMPEVISLSNRVYVMSEGYLTAELKDDQITEENVMRYAIPKRESA
ncbi:sugar ABC transporter ATP-binding protein [Vibrio crassostreae]|uniref:sugar ABC transporter ATP-binding protein n=1 Tax=Vibrio crassostreae TaxID=246167 RepID=UPI00104955AB|nr:sugar ABC transporter ATP-binding protein [Vibrio crassostreae]TCN97479.1 monosaccharide ABC transporter ATP-binding protein (CUT2 family) [Vibrio crassostreae]CAK1746170.1 putative ribose/galactose/methyl galactoside import ATP-binding protein 1 [Vibrio crassostreae]CAK1753495.1 putative ribose/galactose/methyl galactoside import ATP-binding protein 1 [Vibrio crassostreae]CAK1766120.1 putative ribose/galactose/methyl galactoside import ATP-binding protein 1 [Vibrio crassostreae]CAK2548674.